MRSFRRVVRALVTGPARRRPIRALLPVVGVAIGVAAVAAIHHANRSVTDSFRESARAVTGRPPDVTGAACVHRLSIDRPAGYSYVAARVEEGAHESPVAIATPPWQPVASE